MNERKTVALVPAFNEEPRIARVLDVITSSPLVNEIIVLDDGSIDKTSEVASRFPVKVLRWEENRGKGAVLQSGFEEAPDADFFVFLDADLINFNIEHIEKLITPLTWPEPADMTIGVFRQGNKNHVNMAQHYFSILNGQRALRREFVEILPDMNWSRFGVEVLLTKYAALAERKVIYPELQGITHVTKEEKLGFYGGFCHRMQMYQECLYSLFNHKKMIRSHPGKVPPDILKKI
jgi:polyprenyl-phospho-N-acetylgalactosaminyl synthase